MKDLTAVVPWAKNVIRSISLLLLICSCSATKNQSKNDLSKDEYDVINAEYNLLEKPMPLYHKTSNDNDWDNYINIDTMLNERCLPIFDVLSKKELEDLFPEPLIAKFKNEVKRLKSYKLQETRLKKEIALVKSLEKAKFQKISKPIIIDNIAILQISFGKRKREDEIKIHILEKIDGKWAQRYTYCERLILY